MNKLSIAKKIKELRISSSSHPRLSEARNDILDDVITVLGELLPHNQRTSFWANCDYRRRVSHQNS